MRILDQLVGFGDPDRFGAALQPVIEQDARGLPALAGAGAVAEEPAAAKAHRVFGVIRCGRDNVPGLVDRPRSCEKAGMRLTGVDHGFKLGIGQQSARGGVRKKMRPVTRLWWGDRCHRGRLHEFRGMSARAGNPDRLQSIFFIQRVGDAAALHRLPVEALVGDLDRFGLRSLCRDGGASRGDGTRCAAGHGSNADRVGQRGRDRRPWRHAFRDPSEQRGDVRRETGRLRKRALVICCTLVDHGQPRVHGGSVFAIDGAVDRGREHDPTSFLQADEVVTPCRMVGRAIGAGDHDQTPAFGETR